MGSISWWKPCQTDVADNARLLGSLCAAFYKAGSLKHMLLQAAEDKCRSDEQAKRKAEEAERKADADRKDAADQQAEADRKAQAERQAEADQKAAADRAAAEKAEQEAEAEAKAEQQAAEQKQQAKQEAEAKTQAEQQEAAAKAEKERKEAEQWVANTRVIESQQHLGTDLSITAVLLLGQGWSATACAAFCCQGVVKIVHFVYQCEAAR